MNAFLSILCGRFPLFPFLIQPQAVLTRNKHKFLPLHCLIQINTLNLLRGSKDLRLKSCTITSDSPLKRFFSCSFLIREILSQSRFLGRNLKKDFSLILKLFFTSSCDILPPYILLLSHYLSKYDKKISLWEGKVDAKG